MINKTSSRAKSRIVSFTNITPNEQSLILDKLIEATQILHKSVLTRKIKQGLEDIKNGEDYGTRI